MRRTTMVLLLFALAPFLMGAGGGAPTIPGNAVLSTEAISAFIVIDPHEVGITPTAKLASITLRDTRSASQILYAQGSFNVPATFPFFRGCDLGPFASGDPRSLTNLRFVVNLDGNRVSFDKWMPEDFVKALFRQLGRTVDDNNVPVITKVLNGDPDFPGQCMDDPRNLGSGSPPVLSGDSIPGWLFLEAEVRFAVPPKKP